MRSRPDESAHYERPPYRFLVFSGWASRVTFGAGSIGGLSREMYSSAGSVCGAVAQPAGSQTAGPHATGPHVVQPPSVKLP